MRYILDDKGYIDSVSCTPYNCKDKSCQEYTGTIPTGYSSFTEWATNANIRAYKIVNGNLVFDEKREEELKTQWKREEEANLPTDIDLSGYATKEELNAYAKTSSLAKVATTGKYEDLTNEPDIYTLETKADASAKLTEAKTYTDTKIGNLIGTAPETLDTIQEVAQAIEDNETVIEALNSAIGKKANTSDLSKVATSGSYNDLTNKPIIHDTLTSTSTTESLSANQGKVLDEKIESVMDNVEGFILESMGAVYDAIPTNNNQLENGAGYITSIPSEYITESELDAKKYLTSFTESDPTVPSHVKAITTNDISKWNTKDIPTLTSPVRIYNLATGVYKLPKGCVIQYGGASGSASFTISGDAVLLVQTTSENYKTFIATAGISSDYNTSIYVGNVYSTTGVYKQFDFADYVTETELSNKGYLTSYTETDPTVPSHVKNITSSDITNWNNKSNFSGSYNDLTNKPTIPTVPTNISAFNNDKGYLTSVPSEYVTETELSSTLNNKVDKVSGKGLSTNDYTTIEKNKLAGIDTGANKTTVENSLTSTSTTNALSANQGKVLDEKIEDIMGNVEGFLFEYMGAIQDAIPTNNNQLENGAGYQTASDVNSIVSTKQDKLVSGTNIKTINGTSVLGSGDITISSGKDAKVYYGTCTTSASTQAKVVTCSDFVLETGAKISVKFTNGQTYNGTATLNVNGTGAINICRVGTTTTTRYYWSAGEVVDFVYDGTNYVMEGKGVATTTYYGVTKLSSSTSSTSTSLAATPSAVKSAYDLANTANTQATTNATALDNKVDKVEGKDLSTNDYTTAEKTKLSGIETGANKTVVNNTLTSDSTTEALSAGQGKWLQQQIDDTNEEFAIWTQGITNMVTGKQDTLVSGTNIKTINGESLLGSGDITIEGGGSSGSAEGVVLYENSAGTNAGITLSQSTVLMSALEIYYGNATEDTLNYAKLYDPKGKMPSLIYEDVNKTTGVANRAVVRLSITRTAITAYSYYTSELSASGQTFSTSTNGIYIRKVIGYLL